MGTLPPVLADATLIEAPDSQGKYDLHGHVFAPAKGTADGGIDHTHLLGIEVQGMGDLVLVLVRPLPRDDHGDAVLLVNVGEAGLWLQVGVLLGAGVIVDLDDDLCLGPAGLHVAFSYLVV